MLNPLVMIRALRDDEQLSSTEKLVFICAVLRTDNRSHRVRASQEDLAEDTGLTRRTVGTVLRSEAAQRYFEAVRNGRRLDLTWLDMGTNMGTTFPPSTSTTSRSTGTSLEEVLVEPMRSDYLSTEDWLKAKELWEDQRTKRVVQSLRSLTG